MHTDKLQQSLEKCQAAARRAQDTMEPVAVKLETLIGDAEKLCQDLDQIDTLLERSARSLGVQLFKPAGGRVFAELDHDEQRLLLEQHNRLPERARGLGDRLDAIEAGIEAALPAKELRAGRHALAALRRRVTLARVRDRASAWLRSHRADARLAQIAAQCSQIDAGLREVESTRRKPRQYAGLAARAHAMSARIEDSRLFCVSAWLHDNKIAFPALLSALSLLFGFAYFRWLGDTADLPVMKLVGLDDFLSVAVRSEWFYLAALAGLWLAYRVSQAACIAASNLLGRAKHKQLFLSLFVLIATALVWGAGVIQASSSSAVAVAVSDFVIVREAGNYVLSHKRYVVCEGGICRKQAAPSAVTRHYFTGAAAPAAADSPLARMAECEQRIRRHPGDAGVTEATFWYRNGADRFVMWTWGSPPLSQAHRTFLARAPQPAAAREQSRVRQAAAAAFSQIDSRIRFGGQTWDVFLAGYTSHTGSALLNDELAKRRIDDVHAFLSGIPGLHAVARYHRIPFAELHDIHEQQVEQMRTVRVSACARPQPGGRQRVAMSAPG